MLAQTSPPVKCGARMGRGSATASEGKYQVQRGAALEAVVGGCLVVVPVVTL